MEREISISAVSRDSNATSTSNKRYNQKDTTRKSKELTNTIRQLALTAGKCLFNKSILQSQIRTGYVSGKTALKQDFVSLKTRSYANISETVMGQCLEVHRPRAIHNSY